MGKFGSSVSLFADHLHFDGRMYVAGSERRRRRMRWTEEDGNFSQTEETEEDYGEAEIFKEGIDGVD